MTLTPQVVSAFLYSLAQALQVWAFVHQQLGV